MKARLHLLNKNSIAFLCALVSSLAAFAQEPQVDSLQVDSLQVDSLQVDSLQVVAPQPAAPETPAIRDARAYSMQRRFRNRDAVAFRSDSFQDNTFVGLSLGRDNSFRPEYADGVEFSVLAGKWLGAYHGIRGALVLAQGKDNYDGGKISGLGLKASYLFDFAHYLYGYDPYRLWDMSAVIGAGMSVQNYNGNSGMSLSAHIGLDFTFRAFRNLSFFVEPLFNVASNPGLNAHDVNWREYVPTFNASAGMIYNFRNKDYKPSTDFEKFYVFAGGGAQMHNNLINRNSGSLLSGLGMMASAGIGMNCGEWLGFRASGMFSNCQWDSDRNHGIRSNTYMALRLEAVIDILPAINRRYVDARFGISAFLGPESGFMHKLDGGLVINSLYTGATGGLQFRFEVIDGLDVYVEPRVTVLPYSAPTDKPAPQKYWERNYYDGLASLSLGVRYRLK